MRIGLAPALVLASVVVSAAEATPPKITPQALADIARAVERGLVRVQYELRYDRGDPPHGGWFSDVYSDGSPYSEDLELRVDEERTADMPGFVLAPNRVLSLDPIVADRFIKSINVRQGEQLVAAHVVTIAQEHRAVVLELAAPLENAKPLEFASDREPPYFAVANQEWDGGWITLVSPLGGEVMMRPDGSVIQAATMGSLIVDRAGRAVGVTPNGALDVEGNWRASPDTWSMHSVSDLELMLADHEQRVDATILRVSLGFRSPKSGGGSDFDPYGYDPDAAATQSDVVGVVIDERRLLVLDLIKPRRTARLERIRAYLPNGEIRDATFAASLRDYGAFVAMFDEPVPAPAPLDRGAIMSRRDALLLSSEVLVQGESRVAYHMHNRIPSFTIGWRGHIMPHPASFQGQEFIFDESGTLVALPMLRRKRIAAEDDFGGGWPASTASSDIAAVLDDIGSHADPNNVPLSEDEESRLAWLGVELQSLDQELARMSGVADSTDDGMTGAMITFIYEGSPAADAGLQEGDILLRFHVEDQPRPVDVVVAESMFGYGQAFPWEQLDQVPEEFFDQIPTPWPSVESELNVKLTDLGFGTAFTAEVVRDGETIMQPLVVVRSPDHYEGAQRHVSEDIGMTVRDITYEVARYFQRSLDEPGVIVSMVEPGGKASVAGVKPYEIVTHVNDQPVSDAACFVDFVNEGGDELRLSVKRMQRGRIVKIER